jgi:hypothetical protein
MLGLQACTIKPSNSFFTTKETHVCCKNYKKPKKLQDINGKPKSCISYYSPAIIQSLQTLPLSLKGGRGLEVWLKRKNTCPVSVRS